MIVTKEQVKQAIAEGELTFGAFALGTAPGDTKCVTCAVGAVVKSCLGVDQEGCISSVCEFNTYLNTVTTASAVDRLLDVGQYWNALSCYYEGKCDEFGWDGEFIDLARKATIDWVEDNFPDELELITEEPEGW